MAAEGATRDPRARLGVGQAVLEIDSCPQPDLTLALCFFIFYFYVFVVFFITRTQADSCYENTVTL